MTEQTGWPEQDGDFARRLVDDVREPDGDVRPALGEALAADPYAEIARLKAHIAKLGDEHARHSLAVSVHQGRADQQESRAVHAERQVQRLGWHIEQYEKLAEQAAEGERATDLAKELRRRLAPMERMQANLKDAQADLAAARAIVREAFFLRQNGERAPGGSETWRDWERKAERYLRGEQS